MPRYHPLSSYVVGAGSIVSVPSLIKVLPAKAMPIFDVESTGQDVIAAFPEKIEGKTCTVLKTPGS
jgi:hypothetical protein